MDAEGNKIELWEPVDSAFTAMGAKTTKQIRANDKKWKGMIYT